MLRISTYKLIAILQTVDRKARKGFIEFACAKLRLDKRRQRRLTQING